MIVIRIVYFSLKIHVSELHRPFGLVQFVEDGHLHLIWTEYTSSHPNDEVGGQIKYFTELNEGEFSIVGLRNDSIPLFDIKLYDDSRQKGMSDSIVMFYLYRICVFIS